MRVTQPSNAPLPLAGKRVVLGVTGGIAAYKAIEVCRRLIDLGAYVVPVLTDAALNMVGETTFRALASEPPKTSLWTDEVTIPHTQLGQTADVVVVCPATARIISDLRTGRSADLLSATLIATEAPVIVCPAMHTEMWEHPAVMENLDVLAERGVIVVPPEDGRLAGGDIGKGRLAAPETVVEAVLTTIGPNAHQLAGKRVLVSAGGTREPIDPVRFIGNRSSGKQGHAIAEAAKLAGAEVTLVTTAAIPSSSGIRRIDVETAAQMHQAVMSGSAAAHVIVMAAAVADFAPQSASDQKIKKVAGIPSLTLHPTVDILEELGTLKAAGQLTSLLVGFAAETQNVSQNAQSKLHRKNLDLIVANDVAADQVGFAHSTNAVTIYGNDGFEVSLSLRSKEQIASGICEVIADRLKTKHPKQK
ncbi:MAG: bifunctional phosphopantothenoylcysteine decarboxylase/phosphopantothenate--cysteine ligase CoaBC [Acidimicrobiales bacterium]|nr:bifunctional phosphopantothenoylcysteine decarboxylase/phosphopantothenate--cysteine ligase CoaBC [Acidimicrobiales bacterium]